MKCNVCIIWPFSRWQRATTQDTNFHENLLKGGITFYMMLNQLSKEMGPSYQSQAANQPKLHVSDFPLHGSNHPYEILTFVSEQRHSHGLLILQNQTVLQHLQRWEFLPGAVFLHGLPSLLSPLPVPSSPKGQDTQSSCQVITAGMGRLTEH